MWWIYLIAILAAIIVALLLIPATIVINATTNNITIDLKLLLLKKQLYPRKKVNKKVKNESNTKKEKGSEKDKKSSTSVIKTIRGLIDVIKVFLSQLGKNLRVNLKRLNIEVGSEEAANTAMIYAGVCAAYDELNAILSEFLRYKVDKENVSITPNFSSEKINADISLSFSMNLISALGVAIPTLVKYYEKKIK